ncbi:hypothetical protein Patl1_33500 [Pistacia atlantica]|uniref:Uncharacterized protein n=1 Tax=Pistacia atlantica TaxID=434234 RepID=A0ACC0ZNM7_9ROSI|nr:hypothetical protein Patl1_33500 [Pistacia atlantica]
MAKSCIFSFFFFSLLLGHGVIELEASTPVYRNFKLPLSNPFQPYRTDYHFQPAKNWMNEAKILSIGLKLNNHYILKKKLEMWECPDFFPVSNNSQKGVDTSMIGLNIRLSLIVLRTGGILWGWIIELSSEADNVKKGWAGLQAVPRSLWLDKSGKQLMQWPIAEVEKLRENPADVEISFRITEFEKAEVMDPSWTDPESLCIQKGASVKGALGPFGLLVLASKNLKEYTAVFFRIFKNQNKYAVLMCSDQRSSSLNNDNKKTTYGAFLDVDPVHDKLSLRSLIDHSIVESFGGGGKACMTARVYPTMATDDEAHLYAFNYGTEKINITNLSAWSMKKVRIN